MFTGIDIMISRHQLMQSNEKRKEEKKRHTERERERERERESERKEVKENFITSSSASSLSTSSFFI